MNKLIAALAAKLAEALVPLLADAIADRVLQRLKKPPDLKVADLSSLTERLQVLERKGKSFGQLVHDDPEDTGM